MNIAVQLKRGISAEVYKYKKTFTLWLLVLAPAFIPSINFFILWKRGDKVIVPGINPWDTLVSFSLNPANYLFPFFVIMIALLVNNIEYNSNTWKLVYAQPLTRFALYLSKMKVFVVMIFISLMLFATFTIAVGLSMRSVNPALGFDQAYNYGYIYAVMFKIFLATLGVASIQFFISQYWKNLILPLGVGIAGMISFMILMQGWEYAPYHPYGYSIFSVGGIRTENFQLWADMSAVYKSLVVAVAIFTLAGVEQCRKRIL